MTTGDMSVASEVWVHSVSIPPDLCDPMPFRYLSSAQVPCLENGHESDSTLFQNVLETEWAHGKFLGYGFGRQQRWFGG